MKKILITGQMRSGTTFIANFINSHADCCIYRDFLTTIFRISKQLGIRTFNELLSHRTKNIILTNLQAEMLIFNSKSMNITADQFTTLDELFDLSLKILSKKNVAVTGVKVTEAESWVESLLNDTDISVIYLIRDLRDILLSQSNYFVNHNNTFASKKWYKNITKMLALENERLLIIKFEDLITNPEIEVKKLSSFLGISFDHTVDSLEDIKSDKWIANSSFHDLSKTFDKKAVNRWKNIDSEEVLYGSVVYRKLMKKLAYQLNKVGFFPFLKIKIIHLLPFPRKRQILKQKLMRKK